ncbi:MAG TPA: hypothetical protein VGW10_13365 [Solirubrobacteraceae bacterium]|nr:hypothetical protein [Solirubrobacteraceae bacterium]
MRRKLAVAACAVACIVPAASYGHGIEDHSPDLLEPALSRLGLPLVQPPPGTRDRTFESLLQGAPGGFELVGHDPLRSRGMNAALAVHGNYAYVGSRTDGPEPNTGVFVVDISNPAAPKVVNEIGRPTAGNPGESSRELRILPDKGLLIVLNHGCSEIIHGCASAATTVGLAPGVTSNYRFYDITGENAAAPKLVSTYLPSRNQPQTPHEFFIWTDPERPSRVLLYQTTPSNDASGRENLIVTDISKARQGDFPEIEKWTTRIGNPQRDNRLHSLTVSYDGKRAYLAYLGGGFLVADTSDFAENRPEPEVRLVTPVDKRVFWTNPGAHSAIKIPGTTYALTTDEVYGKIGALLPDHGCPWGWVRTIDIAREDAPVVAAEYKLPVNEEKFCETVSQTRENFSSFASHNPTLTRNLAILTWHSAGLQAIDLSDPARPKPAGEFIPEPLPAVQLEDPALSSGEDKVVMWSFPIVKDGLIYAIDLRNGLYVLRYKGPHANEISSSTFLDGNSNSGDVRRFDTPAPGGPATGEGPPAPTADVPPPLPPRACLPTPLAITARAVGPFRLADDRATVALRGGPPQRPGTGSVRYCVEGGGNAAVVFSRAGRARLIATSSPRVAARVVPGDSVRKLRRSFHERRLARGLYLVGRSRVYGVSGGRVTVAAVASREVVARRTELRRTLIRLGLLRGR